MSSLSSTEAFPANTPAASQIFTTVLSEGPLTRLDLARRAGLSAAAVTKAVRPLIEAGYLVEDVDEDARPALGRPANLVRVDGGRALFIGVKVTGDEIIGVLTDLCCRIMVARHLPLAGRDPVPVLASTVELVRELLTEADGLGVPVMGLGIAVSGAVDRAEGVVRYSPFLEWHDVPLAELTAATTGLPVTVDNDVRALTVAEQWFGAGVGLSDFAVVTVGAGIGCGLVVHGKVVAGAHGVAGEIGHVTVDPAGPRATAATAVASSRSPGTPPSSTRSAPPPGPKSPTPHRRWPSPARASPERAPPTPGPATPSAGASPPLPTSSAPSG